MPEYVDIHSHLNFENYDTDREEVIGRLNKENIFTITVGTSVEDSKMAIDLADKNPNLFATVGIHPTHDWTEADFSKLDEMASHPKVVAIGECGLDFFRSPNDEETKKKQGQAFARHIEIALKYDKPLMIHCRNAYDECLSVISAFMSDHKLGSRLRGNMHFFAGDISIAKKFTEIGFTLSFAGPITFARDYDEVMKEIDIKKIMSETDSPFATAAPYRGKRGEPTYVKEIVKKIAEIRQEDFEFVKRTLSSNAVNFFKLS